MVGHPAALHKQRDLPLVRAERGEGDNPAERQEHALDHAGAEVAERGHRTPPAYEREEQHADQYHA